ncbi:MAG: hypothetical protein ACMUIP_15690 [bacterium]
MKSILKTIRLPEEIQEEIQPIMKKNKLNFTEFVIQAIKIYIKEVNYSENIKKSFNAWHNNPHPELENGIDNYIRKMREGRDS